MQERIARIEEFVAMKKGLSQAVSCRITQSLISFQSMAFIRKTPSFAAFWTASSVMFLTTRNVARQ